jgi:2'-5' RNA ligase
LRLFVAVNFDAETKSRLLAIQDKLKKQAVRGNFSKPENLHLTLIFIGETDVGLVPAITEIIKNAAERCPKSKNLTTEYTEFHRGREKDLIKTLCSSVVEYSSSPDPFSVTFSRTGCFRHSGKELWWIGAGGTYGAENGDGLHVLTELRRNIACGLETAGIPFDKRPFKAHITLGREIRPAATIILPEESLTVPVTRVSLMKSEHIAGALTYTELFGLNSGIFRQKER